MVIGRQWRADFLRRNEPKFAVSFPRGAATASNVVPKIEKETSAVLERTAEVAVLAEIDTLVKDLRKNPGVLEKLVLRRRLGWAVGERPLRRQPRDEIFGVDKRTGGEA
jgi:hypothetical protein